MNSHTAMEHLFASYDLTIKVQEKGFNAPHCALRYPDNELMVGGIDLVSIMLRKCDDAVACPMIQQIIDWLRDDHGIRFKIEPTVSNAIEIFIYNIVGWKFLGCFDNDYKAYDKAIEEALKLIP